MMERQKRCSRQKTYPSKRDCKEAVLLLLEDCGSLFVAEDCVLEFAEVGGLVWRNLDLTDDVFAFVVELVVFRSDGGVIAGEIGIDSNGVRSFVDDVARRQGDVEAVTPPPGRCEIDGDSARLIVEWHCVGSNDARTNQEEGASLACVLICCEFVMNFNWLVELGGLDKLEGVQHNSGHVMRDLRFKGFAALFFIGVFENHAQIGSFWAGVRGID